MSRGRDDARRGAEALADARTKLDWATSRHEEMSRLFVEFAHPGGGDERPYGIQFRTPGRPDGLVVATFIVEDAMPPRMSLLAADLVHNTRVALDHAVARLKDRFGGNPRRGGFPVCKTEEAWRERVVDGGQGNPLRGLDPLAVELVYGEQPLHRAEPEADPLVALNTLDNEDKHMMLHPAFVYTDVDDGLELIEIVDPKRIRGARSSWRRGKPLEHGSPVATFFVRGDAKGAVRVRPEARIGFATGALESPRTTYEAMIDRVRGIVDQATALIDSQRDEGT